MPSRTIRPTQAPAPAPFAYTVAPADGFTPNLVSASWDGTGAGGDFLPCVSYYNADGVLIGRAFPDSGAVTAGDAAEVSYFPFRRGGSTPPPPVVPLVTTDGVHTVNPTHELLIDGNMSLANLGAGIARLSAVVPPTSPPVQWQAIRTDTLRTAGGFFSPDWGVPTDTQQSAALVQAAYLGPGFPAGTGLATFVVLTAGTYLFYYYCSCSTLTQDALTVWEANFSTPPYHMFPLTFNNWEALVNVGIHFAQWPQPGFGFGAGAAMLGFFSAVPSPFQSMTVRFAPQAGEDPTGATEGVFVAVRLRP